MNKWEIKKVNLAVQAHAYGFMAVTPNVYDDGDGYGLTHIPTGYRIPPEPFGIDGGNLDDCQRAAKIIVDDFPDIEKAFNSIVESKMPKKQHQDLAEKLYSLLND